MAAGVKLHRPPRCSYHGGMGPILIFDKSVLESLNPDEAVWLDCFYLCNITPLFFVETLADLEKQVRGNRSPEHVVGSLAYKTPEMSARPNVHHATLIEGELRGLERVDMEHGRIIISGGQAKQLEGKTGIIFEQSPEEEALTRWQKHEFLELERLVAKGWRRALSGVNLEEVYRSFQRFLPSQRPRTLLEVKQIADTYIRGYDQERVLRVGLSLIGISPQGQSAVLERWRGLGRPRIRDFAPYFTHVFSVDLFFYLAIACDVVGRDRASNKIDIAYLYYLPFSMAFSSNDRLHARVVPLFLRENQSFVDGTELKEDLAALDRHYDALPDDIKRRGVMSFAAYPPIDEKFLTTRLWDKHMSPNWREHAANHKPPPAGKVSKEIIEEIRRFEEEGVPVPDSEHPSSDDAHHILIKRKVHARKGKWNLLPPEIVDRSLEKK